MKPPGVGWNRSVVTHAVPPFRTTDRYLSRSAERRAPSRVWPFYLYYLRQVWPSFLALLVVGLFASLIEVAMFSYLSRIIDLAQGTPNANFFSEHSGELIWMLVVILLLRPLFFGLHDLLVHQTITPA